MKKIASIDILINQSVELVFDWISDFDNAPLMFDHIVYVRKLEHGAVKEGQILEERAYNVFRGIDLLYLEVQVYSEREKIILYSPNSRLKHSYEFQFHQISSKTSKVTIGLSYSNTNPLVVALVTVFFKPIAENRLKVLKKKFESGYLI